MKKQICIIGLLLMLVLVLLGCGSENNSSPNDNPSTPLVSMNGKLTTDGVVFVGPEMPTNDQKIIMQWDSDSNDVNLAQLYFIMEKQKLDTKIHIMNLGSSPQEVGQVELGFVPEKLISGYHEVIAVGEQKISVFEMIQVTKQYSLAQILDVFPAFIVDAVHDGDRLYVLTHVNDSSSMIQVFNDQTGVELGRYVQNKVFEKINTLPSVYYWGVEAVSGQTTTAVDFTDPATPIFVEEHPTGVLPAVYYMGLGTYGYNQEALLASDEWSPDGVVAYGGDAYMLIYKGGKKYINIYNLSIPGYGTTGLKDQIEISFNPLSIHPYFSTDGAEMLYVGGVLNNGTFVGQRFSVH